MRRSLVAVGSFVVLAIAFAYVAEVADAQPRGKRPKPGKPVAVVDAGAPAGENPSGEESVPPMVAAANAPAVAPDAGATPVAAPIAHIDLADGGIKASPLNPTAAELPPQTPPAAPDFDKLLGDVSALRARVAAVTDTLFRSRIAISLEADGSHAKIARLSVSLDDGVVYNAPAATPFDGKTRLYEHGVAPGRHAVIVDVDRKDDRDDTFRSSQRSRFLVDVPKDQQLEVQLEIDDDSNMGKDFPSEHSGRYDLRVRAKATAKPVK
jgi:hypothetical protein